MPPNDPPETHCYICGAELDPTILGGSCSVCMWSDLINGGNEDDPHLDDAPEIEGYDILEEIGNGGMGIVYRAHQHQPSREVALKIVAPYSLRASQARARFMIEVEAMAAVEHPALLPLYDAGEDIHGRPWLTMQLAHGGTLADWLDTYSGQWKDAARLVVTLCQGVQYAHERGILHRDIKPANILFDGDGNPYIADFGLAKWADEDGGITRSSYLLGSPAYLAPEAAAGGSKVTTTVSDVYGLGAVLYELLCGRKPYEGMQAAEILTQILDRSPVSPRAKLSNIPRDLEVIVMKAMSREPEKRYHSAAAFADDLGRWLEGKMILARPVGKVERLIIWAKRNPALSILSLLLLVSLITGGILQWKSNQELAAALNDAEGRVEFMTRELPAQLEPLGRLDLLDSVFENVSEHYETNGRTDPESLARHADFLTQWSQILRPRGLIKEAITRLELAMEHATEATERGNVPIEALRARVFAGRKLGEALIEDQQYERAKSVLDDTIHFSAKTGKEHADDVRLGYLTAELLIEMAIVEKRTGRPEQALKFANRAVVIWENLVPEMMKSPGNPYYQRALITASRAHYFLRKIHIDLRDRDREDEHTEAYLSTSADLMRIAPGNLHFRHEHVIARQIHIKHQLYHKSISIDEALERYKKVDDDIMLIVSQAPSNVRWRTDAVTNAIRLSQTSEQKKDEAARKKWMLETGERLEPLYKIRTTDLKFLYAHRESGAMCGRYLIAYDWPRALHHLTSALQLQLQICRIDPTSDTHNSLQNGNRQIAGYILEQEGKQAAVAWLRSQAAVYERESHHSGLPVLWKWSAAMCHAHIATLLKRGKQAAIMARSSFDRLIALSGESANIPELPDNIMNCVELMLGSPDILPADRGEVISSLLNALPHLRKKPNKERDEKWLSLILKHSREMPRAMQKIIAEQALKEFFSNEEKNNPYHLELEQLR
ncbi:MAG: serine/threonine protein kinase [Akkermansiaceae bacterium]